MWLDASRVVRVTQPIGVVTDASLLAAAEIPGIWHSGIVVYGEEYFFGQGSGIGRTLPGMTPYGAPVAVVKLGRSNMDKRRFERQLERWTDEGRFTGESYTLFDNNCNAFAQACADFLGVRGVPEYVARQVDYLERELGAPLIQLLKGLYRAMFPRQGAVVRREPVSRHATTTASTYTSPSSSRSYGLTTASYAS